MNFYTYFKNTLDLLQFAIFLKHESVFGQGMIRHDGELNIIFTITSGNSNTSFWIVLQMSKVVAMILVLQHLFLIGKVFLQNQLILVTIRKCYFNFRDVIEGPILCDFDLG